MFVAAAQTAPSQTETLDRIGRAFFAALDRDGGPVPSVALAVTVVVLFVWLVRWVQREARRDRVEREALDAEHERALSEMATGSERRRWFRVPAQLRVRVQGEDRRHRPRHEDCETRDVSEAGVAFLSHTPPAPGRPLRFTLDLGDKRPLSLQGVVVRTEPPPAAGAASLVAVTLGPFALGDRERLAQWVAREEAREIAQMRRGPVCAVCGRPLADGAGEVHPTCEMAQIGGPPRPTLG
jgi:hypothetical protein